MRYRLYETNAAGQVVSGRDIIADSDFEALEIARQTLSGRRCELWQGVRRLAVFGPARDEVAA